VPKKESGTRICPLSFPNHRYLIEMRKSQAHVLLRFTKSEKNVFDIAFSLDGVIKAMRILKIFQKKQMFSISDGIFSI
jgi:hypothetical protein